MIKTSDYLVKKLEALGVDTVFMVSGGGAMHLNDSLGKSKKIRIFKYKNKSRSNRKTQGHRQPYTKLVIEAINA